MRDINFYIEKAKENGGFKNYSTLADILCITRSYMSELRSEKSPPSAKLLFKIADIAGIDKNLALMDLGAWKSDGEVKKTYLGLAKRISKFILVSCFVLTMAGTQAVASPSSWSDSSNQRSFHTIYYHSVNRFRRWLKKTLDFSPLTIYLPLSS